MIIFKKIKNKIYRYIIQPIIRSQYIGLGNGSRIVKPLLITPKYIFIGECVRIRNGARLEGVSSYISQEFSPRIQIENNVTIEQNLHLTCATSVSIGENTSIAANVTITDIHHSYENIDMPIEQQKIVTSSVYIGEDCKIYNNVVILPGTVVGKHCSIGANSVVSGIYPDFCVIVGVPAKIVKRYSFEQQAWLKTDAEGNFI